MNRRPRQVGLTGWLCLVTSIGIARVKGGYDTYISQDLNVVCTTNIPIKFDVSEYFKGVSRMTCAAVCQLHRCLYYMYQEGNCTTVGELPSPFPVIGSVSMLTFKRHILDNVALHKNTTSVPYWVEPTNMVSGMAVDGDEGNNSYFHSNVSIQTPWWIVDLNENHIVKEVHILANGDKSSHSDNFRHIEVHVGSTVVTNGDFSSWTLMAKFTGPAVFEGGYIPFVAPHDLCGRYVSVQKMKSQVNEYMIFNEVKVFGYREDL